MIATRIGSLTLLAAVLGGCAAEAPYSVAPGQGKTYADLQRDDAACRSAPVATAPGSNAAVTTPSTTAPDSAPPASYYQCMAAKGEMVVANRTVAYPVYAGYPYYPYAYPYAYPYYGYPYSAALVGPYVGIGLGFGGGYYRGGYWHGGYRDGFRGGDFRGGDFRGGGRQDSQAALRR